MKELNEEQKEEKCFNFLTFFFFWTCCCDHINLLSLRFHFNDFNIFINLECHFLKLKKENKKNFKTMKLRTNKKLRNQRISVV